MLLWLWLCAPLAVLGSDKKQHITLDWQSDLWKDKAFRPRDRVVVSGVNNLPDNSVLMCVAYDYEKEIFVLRGGDGKIWGVAAQKLRPLKEMELTSEWQLVPPGMSVPAEAEYRIDVATGEKMARKSPGRGEGEFL
mmetsp:Transcript_56002/g.156072  ORF Transcript_56002/g.156072 Transcript_56002/m.156072 type:complete len:136 (+) Transcript_56002:49-456(+)